jgi:Fe-S cluster assembly ATP-binding protein
MLAPQLVILDEIDSGLDVDALQWVSQAVNSMRSPDRSVVLITHYQRLLNAVEPDLVFVMADGRVVESGGKEIALRIEREGYGSGLS